MCTFLLQKGALWDICLMHCGWDRSVDNKSAFHQVMNWNAKDNPYSKRWWPITLFVFMPGLLTFCICITPVCNMNHITRPRGQCRWLIAMRCDVPMGTAHTVFVPYQTRDLEIVPTTWISVCTVRIIESIHNRTFREARCQTNYQIQNVY